ncbi:MAG TPA: hypothetical protein DEO44_06930 [Verrucomicrobia subdivision 6 bacterium]|nr:hypothetical protein [Verrucomicrobia subdivision 6 bacterium]
MCSCAYLFWFLETSFGEKKGGNLRVPTQLPPRDDSFQIVSKPMNRSTHEIAISFGGVTH